MDVSNLRFVNKIMRNSIVFIDSRSNLLYSSFYIHGLYDVHGRKQVRFSTKYFKELKKEDEPYSYDAYMAMVIVENEKEHKIIIDFGDGWPIRELAYSWCDVYAKINFNPSKTSKSDYPKVLPITPGFGLKIWNIFEASYYMLSNLIKLKGKPQISIKNYFRSYLSQLKQVREKSFTDLQHKVAGVNYVFFVSSLWKDENCLTGTNLYRKMFVESCIKNKLGFEGGFWCNDPKHPQYSEFKDITFSKRYELKEYVEKTKNSVFAFNTPAVHNCHGWKLGQFLAMGKAIISTPLENELNHYLVHGQHIHYVNDPSEMDAAVKKLTEDNEYRQNLEKEARQYYTEFASPSAVINQILDELKNKLNSKISIIVPVYNVEKYLSKCLDTLIHQSFQNLEIIVINDGSTDSSPELCEKYASQDLRVKVIHRENGGLSAARNSGLDVASGEYISFVDSDDFLSLSFYECLLSAAIHENADIVECDFRKFSAEAEVEQINKSCSGISETFSTEDSLKLLMLEKLRQIVWNKLYRRDVIQDLRFAVGRLNEDEYFTYKAFGNSKKILKIPDVLYFYRQHEASIMGEKYSIKRNCVLRRKAILNNILKIMGGI